MYRFAPALMLPLLACQPTLSLTGDWMGDAQCGEGSSTLAWTIPLEASDEEGIWQGASEFSFDTTSGEIVLSFGLELRVPDTDATDSITLDMDVVDCADNVNGSFNCWSAEGVWDLGDDEINGTFSGVPVNSGECDYTIERSS